MRANPRPLRVGGEISAVAGAGAAARLPAFSRQGRGSTCSPGPRALTAGARRRPSAAKPRARGRPRGRAAGPRPRRPVGPRSNRPPFGRPPCPSSAPERPPHLLGYVRLDGRGSQKWGLAGGAHHGHRGEAVPATPTRLPGGGMAAQGLRSFPVAGPPLLRHPSHVTGSAHAEGRGPRLGAGPVRGDWRPRNHAGSAVSTECRE